jgi:hypothetical protein
MVVETQCQKPHDWDGCPIYLPLAIFRTTACIRAPNRTVEEPVFDEPQGSHRISRQPVNCGVVDRPYPVEILIGIVMFATALGKGAADD